MRGWMTSTSAGVVSGTVTCAASLHALGYTSALVMPSWASPDAWNALVVLGVGATLVALVVHSIVLHVLRCRTALALVSFFGTTLVAMAFAGLLAMAARTLLAWLVGAFLASLAYRRLRPGAPGRTAPLGGTA